MTEPQPATVGASAPDIEVVDVRTGKQVELRAYRGRVVLLNLFATWCGACRDELPAIQKLHGEFGDDGLSVVAVSLDEQGAEADVAAFIGELGLTFDVFHEAGEGAARLFRGDELPRTYVIDRRGKIVRQVSGPAQWASALYRTLIADLLEASGPAT
jgi:peroxiredoxin